MITLVVLSVLGVRYYVNYQTIVNDQQLIQVLHQALLKETRARLFQLESVVDDRLLTQDYLAIYHPDQLPELTQITDEAYQAFVDSLQTNGFENDLQQAWQQINFYRQSNVTCHSQEECSFIAENLNKSFISVQNKLLFHADYRFRQIPFISEDLVQLTQLQSHMNRWYVVSEHLAFNALMIAISPSEMWQESLQPNLIRWQTHQELMQDLVQLDYSEDMTEWVDLWRIQQTQMAFQVDAVLGHRALVHTEDLVIRQLNRYQNLHGQLLNLVVLNRTSMMTSLRASMIKNVFLFGSVLVFLIFLILALLVQARINRQDHLKALDQEQAFLESGDVATVLLNEDARLVKYNNLAEVYLSLDILSLSQKITRWMPDYEQQLSQLKLEPTILIFTDSLGNQLPLLVELNSFKGRAGGYSVLKLKKPSDKLAAQKIQDKLSLTKLSQHLFQHLKLSDPISTWQYEQWLGGAIHLLDVESAWLATVTEDGEATKLEAKVFLSNTLLNQNTIQASLAYLQSESIFYSNLTNGRTLVANHLQQDERWSKLVKDFPALQNFLCFPILDNGCLLGILGFVNQKYGFNEEWVQMAGVMQTTAVWACSYNKQLTALKQKQVSSSTANTGLSTLFRTQRRPFFI